MYYRFELLLRVLLGSNFTVHLEHEPLPDYLSEYSKCSSPSAIFFIIPLITMKDEKFAAQGVSKNLSTYSIWQYNVTFCSVFTLYNMNNLPILKCMLCGLVLRTASEQLQNEMILWTAEQLDTGETTCACVELWNECSQMCVTIVFTHRVVWRCNFILFHISEWTMEAYVFPTVLKKQLYYFLYKTTL